MKIFVMRWSLLRTCVLITATYLTLWVCFTTISQWNLPPPLAVPANLPPSVTGAPGRFDVVALPAPFEANAVNNKGEVVGTWNTHEQDAITNSVADSVSSAAVWFNGKARLIPRLGDTRVCGGVCLSDSGWLGGSGGNIYVDPYQDPSYAVVWNAAAKQSPSQCLGHLPNLSRATVLAINDRAQAVGTSAASYYGEMRDGATIVNAPAPYIGIIHAFFWDGQKMRDLGEGEACGINENAQIVGTQNKKIVLWQNGRSYVLGDGKACAINNRGQIVGTSFVKQEKPSEQEATTEETNTNNTEKRPTRALLWDKGVATDLGTLADGWDSTAVALNDRGQIVGNSAHFNNWEPTDARAFLWQAGKMVDLNTRLPKNSGWVLCEARSINNKGWIVAMGTLRGETRSFLLIPK